MPGITCQLGNVTRLEVPIPFFLREDPFSNFRSPNYDWDVSGQVTLLVQTKPKIAPRGYISAEHDESVELSGCPLECPFDPNENFDIRVIPIESTFPGLEFAMDLYEPISVNGCRNLIRDIYMQKPEVMHSLGLDRSQSKSKPSDPIYMACDGNTQSKDLVLIGFHNKKFLEVRMTGPYNSNTHLLGIDLFLSYHQHLPDVVPGEVKKQVHAIYEKIHGDFESSGKVFMEFVWADPKAVFEQPPATKAKAKLAIRPKPGDANPFLKEYWEELSALELLLTLRETQAGEMNKTHLQVRSFEDNPSTVLDEITEFLKLPSTPAWGKGRDLSSFLIPVMERVQGGDRTDLDFTDAVWSIVKKATSILEVWECCIHILSSIENKLFRPYLYPTNNTIFAELTKELVSGTLKNFRVGFNPTLAIDMIIDMGINKIFRDFSFILKTCAIVQQDNLDTYIPRRKQFRESISNLKKLHCLLEILSLSNERLAVAGSDLEYQAQEVLKHFKTKSLNWDHTFHFDIHMSLISTVLIGMHPVYWNLQLDSSSVVKTSRTNAILSRDVFLGYANTLFTTPDQTLPRGYYLYIHRVAERKSQNNPLQ